MIKAEKYFLIAVLFSRLAFAQSELWTPRSPLNYPTSVHSILSKTPTEKLSYLSSILTAGCISAIREFLNSGRDFYSEVMKKDYSELVSESRIPEVADGEFFHYTNADAVQTIALNQAYDRIFHFLRQKSFLTDWYLYVAADPESSRRFGYYKIRIRLRPQAQVFFSGHKKKEASISIHLSGHEGDLAVEFEQIQKDPSLSVCRGLGQIGDTGHNHPILTILAAEANQIDVIAYFGGAHNWHQLLGVWSIQQMSLN